MATERLQRRINSLLDEADDAIAKSDWDLVRDRAQNVLTLDPDNPDAQALVAAADRALSDSGQPTIQTTASTQAPSTAAPDRPTSFADGRYQVDKSLDEGCKKRVYLAHDTTLDSQVAFALTKTDGLDDTSRSPIQREAQAMGETVQAAAHFEDSLAFCRNASHRPELAWTCCDYADLLLDSPTSSGRTASDDRAKAMSLLEESLAISSELGMRPLMERVLARREILGA